MNVRMTVPKIMASHPPPLPGVFIYVATQLKYIKCMPTARKKSLGLSNDLLHVKTVGYVYDVTCY